MHEEAIGRNVPKQEVLDFTNKIGFKSYPFSGVIQR